jgi:uncharacterized protein YbaR (Trm112 family)
MATIYTVERHHEVLNLWRDNNATGLRVVHLDFHCDMRGMLVDRRRGLAYRIRDGFPDLDQGNFLGHAVAEGRIDAIRWVHDQPGGRSHDIGTVKFESDLTALPHRAALAVRRRTGIPLAYEVVGARDWDGLHAGEVLDIDWDHFTCLDYPAASIAGRLAAFWKTVGEVIPEETYVCYSPEYSHPTREQYARFVADLAERFAARIVAREAPVSDALPHHRQMSRYLPAPLYRGARTAYRRTALALKQRGIF